MNSIPVVSFSFIDMHNTCVGAYVHIHTYTPRNVWKVMLLKVKTYIIDIL